MAQVLTDEWQIYTGDYTKQPYALRLKDGREVKWAWPNAGVFNDFDSNGGEIHTSDITHVRRAYDPNYYYDQQPR